MASALNSLPQWLQTMESAAFSETAALAEVIYLAEYRLKLKTIGHIAESQELGHHFKNNILCYIHGLDEIKADVAPLIQETARQITVFLQTAYDHGNIHPAQISQLRGPLWVQLASALAPLGGRPRKKVCALLTDMDENLVGWDVNHFYPGIPLSAEAFVKHDGWHRGNLVGCSEKHVISSFLGVKLIVCSTDDIWEQHALAQEYDQRIATAAATSKELPKHYLTVSLCPCASCKKLLLSEQEDGSSRKNIKGLYSRRDPELEAVLTRPDRLQTGRAMEELKSAGMHLKICGRPNLSGQQTLMTAEAA